MNQAITRTQEIPWVENSWRLGEHQDVITIHAYVLLSFYFSLGSPYNKGPQLDGPLIWIFKTAPIVYSSIILNQDIK